MLWNVLMSSKLRIVNPDLVESPLITHRVPKKILVMIFYANNPKKKEHNHD